MNVPNWHCPKCGYEMWAQWRGNVEFSVILGCPGCGTAMDRLDALGEIETAAREDEPLNLRDWIDAA